MTGKLCSKIKKIKDMDVIRATLGENAKVLSET